MWTISASDAPTLPPTVNPSKQRTLNTYQTPSRPSPCLAQQNSKHENKLPSCFKQNEATELGVLIKYSAQWTQKKYALTYR
jgi:hypothetical protein